MGTNEFLFLVGIAGMVGTLMACAINWFELLTIARPSEMTRTQMGISLGLTLQVLAFLAMAAAVLSCCELEYWTY